MTYDEAVEFADSTKKYGSILGLESIRNLMQELGNVQEQLHIIHVAGTNGKGSVCAFLSAALTEAGYQVGRYNSPAVFERREVFRIGETMISKEEYAAVFERVQTACEVLKKRGCPHPTVFEVETAAAFLWFYEKMRPRLIRDRYGRRDRCDQSDHTSGMQCADFDWHGSYAVFRKYHRRDRKSKSRDHQKRMSGSCIETG